MKIQRADAKGFLLAAITKHRLLLLPVGLLLSLFLLVVVQFLTWWDNEGDLSTILQLSPQEEVEVDEEGSSSDSHPQQPPTTTTTSMEYPPLDCPKLLDDVHKNRSTFQDPNNGEIYQRRTNMHANFIISLHNKNFDYTRWSIMEWGHYYERDLIAAFSEVLNNTIDENNNNNNNNPELVTRVLDVGGNIGYFTLEAAAHGHVVVDTFEPNIINAFRLCQSLELNGWRNEFQPPPLLLRQNNNDTTATATSQVNCHPYGVGKEVGNLAFADKEHNPGQGKFQETTPSQQQNLLVDAAEKEGGSNLQIIPVLTLDAFAKARGWFDTNSRQTPRRRRQPDIAILKIDTEGFEINVIQGAKRLLESHLVRNIFMEVSARNKNEIDETRFCLGLIASSGYDVYKYGGFRGPKHEVNWSGNNITDLQAKVIYEVTKKKHKQINLWWKLSTTTTTTTTTPE